MRCAKSESDVYLVQVNGNRFKKQDIKNLEWGFDVRSSKNVASRLTINGDTFCFSELDVRVSKNKLNYAILFWNLNSKGKNFIVKKCKSEFVLYKS